tara:strand:- start:298 stop:708 length:411 start_codon:yes stop_codon:yes gene_type:complete
MKKTIIIALTLILTSCGSTYDLSTDYKIKSILTITEAGDTLAVPVRDFKFRVLDRRIQELINRDQFRYQYRQDWRWNYNMYNIPRTNRIPNFNRSSTTKPKYTPKVTKPIENLMPPKPNIGRPKVNSTKIESRKKN